LFLLNVFNIGYGVVEGGFSQVACLGWVVQNFVVKDGKVEGKTESNWMSGFEVRGGEFGGLFVGLVGGVGCLVVLFA